MFVPVFKAVRVASATLALVGTLAGGTAAIGPPGEARSAPAAPAPAVDDAAIARLVDLLKSGSFRDRERATAELDRIGAPALDALRKAARRPDAEQKERAEGLVRKIEAREEEGRPLAPRRVHLVFKGAPVAEALAEFRRQSGYDLVATDPADRLKDRTVTLDSGDATFWQAVDLFCAKAGLVAAASPPRAGGVARPGGGGGGVIGQPQLTFADGQPPALPTDGRTAVRVRAVPAADGFDPPAAGEVLLALEVTAEPVLSRLRIVGVRVRTATDDRGQALTEVAPADPAPAGPDAGAAGAPTTAPPAGADRMRHTGWGSVAPVRLKKGAKPATSLAEVTGTVTVRVPAAGLPGTRGESVTRDVPFTLKDIRLR